MTQPTPITHSEELGLLERFQLLTILPTEGDIVTVRIVADLRRELAVTEEEIVRYGVVQTGEQLKWNTEVDNSKSVSMGPRAMALIAQVLRGMSDKKKLTIDYLPLYERFANEGN